MPSKESPTIAQWQLAQVLTALRGRTPQRQLAKDLEIDASTLVRWEGGETVPREKQLRKVLAHFDLSGEETERLVKLRTDAVAPAWWHDADVAKAYGHYIDLERVATQIATYQDRLVPGLLQTEAYARAILIAGHPRATTEEIDGLLDVRLTRQEEWAQSETLLWAIVDQAALEKHIGGRTAMSEQVKHLLAMAEHPRVDLQVLPNSAGAHAALQSGSFVLVEVDNPAMQAVYVEAHTRNLLLDHPKEVAAHRGLLDRLRAAAANTPQTHAILTQLLRQYESPEE
ncbi:helix-turn-helix domain-containing protein [Nocardiopsis dassonvillei]|uniref:helix-turn-helix domain-containing protein n=1 Tax=Nocardiopsis dassonvillei TaxID=2014 RepID=UPI000B9D7103|nr:helix-turn-helix transcriptional regulator [Nocardiopsis dassonvillei]ASU61084.1 hypothetical protein CGQ36_27560 [Nocardiopsis dassonvillei]